MTYPCRCRECRGRKSLAHPPGWYLRPPRCACGARSWWLDTHRMKNPDSSRGGPVCKGDCLPYPHRMNDKRCRHYEEWVLERSLVPGNKAGKVAPGEGPNF